jgi:hypothetical protein
VEKCSLQSAGTKSVDEGRDVLIISRVVVRVAVLVVILPEKQKGQGRRRSRRLIPLVNNRSCSSSTS